jgi:NADH-quinone oxidoreductase subunit M
MSLIALIIWPLAGGLLAWLAGRWNKTWPRWISLAVLVLHFCVLVVIGVPALGQVTPDSQKAWAIDFTRPWIPQWGVAIHLAMDGLSFLLLLLVDFLGVVAVAASWIGIQERVGFFHFNLLWILAALVGVFLALDLILFYLFWEMMLVPLYFLIGIWGHENRVYAALKFFIFTQASGLLMLLSILGLYFLHGQDTGTYTFDYLELLGTSILPSTAMWLMLGFFAAFAVKLSAVPVHTWLPDAHTEAPTAGSVILAGLLLKAGAYGLLRFLVPLFPGAAFRFAPVAMALGSAGIIYGAILAFAQTDLKRLVAYTSISHMGFVLVGIFAWNQLALQGAVVVMLAHGVTTGALFVLVGYLQERTYTRDLRRLGGLWSAMPAMGGVAMFLAAASLGLPGLANFVGEFLVLLGAYVHHGSIVVVAAVGFVLAAAYALWMIQRAFAGPSRQGQRFPDLTRREATIMALLIVAIVGLGLYPQPALDTAQHALETMQHYAVPAQQVTAPTQPGDGDVP